MSNFLKETLETIEAAGKTFDDVVFIGDRAGNYCPKERFHERANVEYDEDYGAPEIATDVIVMFSDGSWLERFEYDGAEIWSYKTPYPARETREIQSFKIHKDQIGWETLASINNTQEEETTP